MDIYLTLTRPVVTILAETWTLNENVKRNRLLISERRILRYLARDETG